MEMGSDDPLSRLGISPWSVPWAVGMPDYPPPPAPLDAGGLLEKAAALGVRRVQFAETLPLHVLPDRELDGLAGFARAHGLTLEPGTRGIDPDHLLRYLDVAGRLGATTLRTLTNTPDHAPDIAEAARLLAQVLPRFEAVGVTLALENNEAHKAAEYAWLMRELSGPALGITLDTVNAFGRGESLETVLELLAPFCVVLHAKEYAIRRIDTRLGFVVTGAPAGQGMADWGRVLDVLEGHGRHPSVILEQWPPFADTIEETLRVEEEWLHQSLRFLRSVLAPV